MVGGLSFSVGKKLTPFQKHKKEEEDKKRVQIPHAPSPPPRPEFPLRTSKTHHGLLLCAVHAVLLQSYEVQLVLQSKPRLPLIPEYARAAC